MKLPSSRGSRLTSKIASKIAVLAAVTLAAGSASALTPFWTTAVDGNWNDQTKWTGSGVSGPVAGDAVTFNAVGQNGNETIYLNGNRAASSLAFTNTGTTTLLGGVSGGPANNTLTLTGGITVNAGAGIVTIGDTALSPTAKVDVVMTSGGQLFTSDATLILANNLSITSATYSFAGTGSVSIGSVSQAAAGTATWNNTASLSIGSYTTSSASAVALSSTGSGIMTITGNITQGAGQLTLRRENNPGTLILQGTSNMTGPVQITNGTIQTAVTSGVFGTTTGISIGSNGVLALRGDSSASFTNGSTAYPIIISSTGATIDANQVTSAGPNTVLTLGVVSASTAGAWVLNITGANSGVGLGAVSGANNVGKTFSNANTAATGLTIASYTDTATTAQTLTFNGVGNTTVTGAITQGTGNIAVTHSGSGILKLNGANSYSGLTTVSTAGATLQLGGSNSGTGGTTVGNATSTLILAGATVNPLASGALTLNAGVLQAATSGHILNNTTTLTGNFTISGSNSLEISGNFTNSGGNRNLTSSISTGTLTLSGNIFLSEASGTGRTFVVSGNGTTNISGVIANFNGAGTAGNLSINNSGTTTLSNVNTYTGNTTVQNGTTIISGGGSIGQGSPTINIMNNGILRVDGAIVAGTGGVVNIGNNGTLTGGGSVNKSVAFTGTGGKVSPGNSPGILVTGAETWINGNTYVWELNNWTNSPTPGVDYDQIQIGGALNISALTAGGFTIDINGLTAGNVIGAIPGYDNTVNRSWTIATFSGGLTGSFDANLFNLVTTNFTGSNPLGGGGFSLTQSGNNLILNFTSTGLTPAAISANPVNSSTLISGGTVTVTNTAVGGTVDPAVLSNINVTNGLAANGTWGQTGLSTSDINGAGGNQIGTVTKTDASNVLNGAKTPGTLTFDAAGKTVTASSGQGSYSYTLSGTTSGHFSPTGAGTTFGTAQTAAVANGDKVAGLSSTEDSSLLNTLTLVDSTPISGPTSVSVQWRHRSANETYPGTVPPLPTDISSLITDVATVDLGANAPTAYVVQMDYDPAGLGGISESVSFAAGHLYLAHMVANVSGPDTGNGGAEDLWKNATLDSGNPQAGFLRGYLPSDLSTIGSWGVDSVNHVAWAVLPGTVTGQFAVVPEPASLSLLAIGAAGLLMRRRR